MEIIYLKEVESTQKYLIERVLKKDIYIPTLVWTKNQTDGIGSRNNHWEGGEGNLFLSFVVDINSLPSDLPIASASIYFSYLIKEVLSKYREDIFVKWPNDLYINGDKVGGIITKKIDNTLICGIGVNLKSNANRFVSLNIDEKLSNIIDQFICNLNTRPSWKYIFTKYYVEFEKNRDIFATIDGKKLNLRGAILDKDGSLIIDNRRFYSLR